MKDYWGFQKIEQIDTAEELIQRIIFLSISKTMFFFLGQDDLNNKNWMSQKSLLTYEIYRI